MTAAAGRVRGGSVDRAKHRALLYADEQEFLGGVVPFIRQALEGGDPVIATATRRNLAGLRKAFGNADALYLEDVSDWYEKPVVALGNLISFLHDAQSDGSRATNIVGEIPWPKNDEPIRREWGRYEAALTEVFEPHPMRVLCAYRASLPAPILKLARRAHPVLVQRGAVAASADYVAPARLFADLVPRLRLPDEYLGRLFDRSEVEAIGAYVMEQAAASGLDESAGSGLAAAAMDVVLDSSADSQGPVLVAIWREGTNIMCQVEGSGPGLADRVGRYGPPGEGAERAWRPWLARQLCDLMEVGVGSLGTAVRLRMRGAALP